MCWDLEVLNFKYSSNYLFFMTHNFHRMTYVWSGSRQSHTCVLFFLKKGTFFRQCCFDFDFLIVLVFNRFKNINKRIYWFLKVDLIVQKLFKKQIGFFIDQFLLFSNWKLKFIASLKTYLDTFPTVTMPLIC